MDHDVGGTELKATRCTADSCANIITGGICCGKSSVANLLKLEGYKIISADTIAHESINLKRNAISEHFGAHLIKDGEVDREALGKIVFEDNEKRKLLESILHPVIRERISAYCMELDRKKSEYFVEIPLFFESDFAYAHRSVICVYSPRYIQIERLIKRNNLTQQDAMKRIDSQMDIEVKKSKSDFVIDNSKDLKHLQQQVSIFLGGFQNPSRAT